MQKTRNFKIQQPIPSQTAFVDVETQDIQTGNVKMKAQIPELTLQLKVIEQVCANENMKALTDLAIHGAVNPH